MKAKGIYRKLLPILLVICFQITGFSQTPQGFAYQAVIRDGSGSPIANKAVRLRITLQDASQVSYYTESQTTTSNAQGVISVNVGAGTQEGNNTFTSIPWKNADVYMKVEIDPDGGTSYTTMGTPTKILSVPYALFAQSIKEVVSPSTAQTDDPIFEVKNKLGQVIFGVYEGGVRIYVEDSQIVKGTKGGFAVGGLTNQAKGQQEYFRITPDSARIWIKEVPSVKGAKGGFAVGGLTNQAKTTSNDYFNVSPNTIPAVINDNAQLLWYPLKEAFLVGRVQVLDPANVGLNSFASGYHSMAKGDYSQALGYNTIASNTYATAIGESCIASGLYSFAFGSQAQATNTNNIAIGYQTESSGASDCYAFGKLAKVLTNSSNSYAFGNSAQVLSYSTNSYALGNTSLVTGSTDCYAFGTNASVSGGLNSYAIGSNSKVAYGSNTAWGSYAIGDNAECYGQRAYALGSHARALNNDAIAFGTNTKSTAYVSIAIGANGSNADTTYATGQASIAMGYAANSGGGSSISIGTRSVASTNYSIGLGYQASATGVNSCAFGSNTQANFTNSTAIGYGALADADNKVRIGNSGVTVIQGQVAFTSASDMRLKKNIKDLSAGLDFILKLRPVEFQMKQGDDKINYGFIAQDIEKLIGTNNSMLTIGADPDRTLGLRYTDFIAPLVKALQEQQLQIDALKAENAQLKNDAKEIQNLKNELEAIKKMLKK